jgi:putative endonuclease
VENRGYVYILSNRPYETLYVGVTSNLPKRVWEHKEHLVAGFTTKYRLDRLVWYECHESIEEAITGEKQIKEWRRGWKVNLIQSTNPNWNDLYDQLTA